MALESPEYTMERHLGRAEIRRYEPYLVASAKVTGPLESAGNAGFGILARYIFGGNDAGGGASTKISMTTPVIQVPMEESFVVRFMVPSEYTADSVPTPTDDRVTIEEIGPQRLAALRYRGRWTRRSHDRHLRELRNILGAAGKSTTGEPIWARYDPPWKPPFLRHNEVLLALDN